MFCKYIQFSTVINPSNWFLKQELSLICFITPKSPPGSSISQKFADLLLTTESLVFTGNELLEKCGLKPNMIVKALETRLVKPILQNRGWRRIRSMEYFGYGRVYLLVRGKENS